MKKPRAIRQLSPQAIDDAWQRRAVERAIEAVRGIVSGDGPVPPRVAIGRVSDVEWGWIISAVLFAWIATRAEQAAAEQLETEQMVRLTGLDPDPWDAGAVIAILPELAEACSTIDWLAPLASWSRETMSEFLLTALRLVCKAQIARDLSAGGITRKSTAPVIAREANAAAGGPLMTLDELNDDIDL